MTDTTVALPPDGGVIPVWETFKRAYIEVFSHLDRVYLLAWMPLAVTVFLTFTTGFIDGFLRTELFLTSTVGVYATYLTNAYFAVAFHRYQLFGWSKNTSAIHIAFGKAERVFVLFATGFYLLYSLPPVLLVKAEAVNWLGLWFVVVLLALPPVVGLSLCFPAAAAGHDRPVAFGWNLGKGSWARLFGIAVLCVIPPVIAGMLLGPLGKDYPTVMPFVIAVVSYPFAAAGIAAICAAYKIKTGKVAPAGDAAAGAP